jgi:indole-3-acetate monooxygenase
MLWCRSTPTPFSPPVSRLWRLAIPASVVDALRDAGVFHLLAPRAVGGAEADPLSFLRVVEEVSYADGAAGWCTMIGGCYAIFGGMLRPEGAHEIFGDPATISAGNFRPDKGVAQVMDGGYRVSGRRESASGASHANWYIAGAMLVQDGAPITSPMPAMREFFFPASEARLIDTWESTGLRGTASHDYETRDIFVPGTAPSGSRSLPPSAGRCTGCRPSRCSPASSPPYSSASHATRSTRSSSSQPRRSRPCRRSFSRTG